MIFVLRLLSICHIHFAVIRRLKMSDYRHKDHRIKPGICCCNRQSEIYNEILEREYFLKVEQQVTGTDLCKQLNLWILAFLQELDHRFSFRSDMDLWKIYCSSHPFPPLEYCSMILTDDPLPFTEL